MEQGRPAPPATAARRSLAADRPSVLSRVAIQLQRLQRRLRLRRCRRSLPPFLWWQAHPPCRQNLHRCRTPLAGLQRYLPQRGLAARRSSLRGRGGAQSTCPLLLPELPVLLQRSRR